MKVHEDFFILGLILFSYRLWILRILCKDVVCRDRKILLRNVRMYSPLTSQRLTRQCHITTHLKRKNRFENCSNLL